MIVYISRCAMCRWFLMNMYVSMCRVSMGFYGFYILCALGSMMFNVREKSAPFQFSRHWRYRILVNCKSKLLFFSTFRFLYLYIAAETPDTDPRRADARRYVAHKTNNAVWCGVTLPVLKVEKCIAISCWGGERSRASRRWTVAGAAGFGQSFWQQSCRVPSCCLEFNTQLGAVWVAGYG